MRVKVLGVLLNHTFVVLILFPVAQLQPFRSGRTLHSSPSRHGCIWHHHFCSTMEAVNKGFSQNCVSHLFLGFSIRKMFYILCNYWPGSATMLHYTVHACKYRNILIHVLLLLKLLPKITDFTYYVLLLFTYYLLLVKTNTYCAFINCYYNKLWLTLLKLVITYLLITTCYKSFLITYCQKSTNIRSKLDIRYFNWIWKELEKNWNRKKMHLKRKCLAAKRTPPHLPL